MSQSYNFFEVLPLIDEISSHSSDLAIDRSSRIPKKSILENEINPVTKTKGLQEKKNGVEFHSCNIYSYLYQYLFPGQLDSESVT